MGWFQKLVYGVDLEEEQRRQDELDAQLREMNERDYAPGGRIYERIEAERGTDAADDTYQDALENLDESRIDNVEGDVNDAFREGLEEGYGNIRDTVAAPFKIAWNILPWQVWVAAAVALFLYMGGGLWLRGILGKLK